MYAIGLIEVNGYVTAVEALDAMLKTANVEFVTWEKKLGGRLVTIIVKGDVSSVEEAILSGKIKADNITRTVAYAVIPNPHPETMKMVNISAGKLFKVDGGEINEF
ncbi:BMC domain-containing protein [Thermoanaerobacterium thermosaccharolyticum]|uniref:BMC domain-containing protein n=1 Tax=Thermoanaerobacterium thermosaccharolyticum TaxID=1517 RepID=UPI003DA96755